MRFWGRAWRPVGPPSTLPESPPPATALIAEALHCPAILSDCVMRTWKRPLGSAVVAVATFSDGVTAPLSAAVRGFPSRLPDKENRGAKSVVANLSIVRAVSSAT